MSATSSAQKPDTLKNCLLSLLPQKFYKESTAKLFKRLFWLKDTMLIFFNFLLHHSLQPIVNVKCEKIIIVLDGVWMSNEIDLFMVMLFSQGCGVTFRQMQWHLLNIVRVRRQRRF